MLSDVGAESVVRVSVAASFDDGGVTCSPLAAGTLGSIASSAIPVAHAQKNAAEANAESAKESARMIVLSRPREHEQDECPAKHRTLEAFHDWAVTSR
jgi:hypothetical protein